MYAGLASIRSGGAKFRKARGGNLPEVARDEQTRNPVFFKNQVIPL
jgi:hypothetical protein